MSTTNSCVNNFPFNSAVDTTVLDTVSTVLKRVLCTLSLWYRRRTGRQHLLQLDDRLLKDIGISRADAEFEARKPFWND